MRQFLRRSGVVVTTAAIALGLAVAVAAPAAAATNFTFRADYCTGESSLLYASGKNLHPGDRYALYQTDLPGSESHSNVVEISGRITLELALLAAEFDNGRTITARVALVERNGLPVQAEPIASFTFGTRCTLVTGKVTVAGKAADSLAISALPWTGKSFRDSDLDHRFVYGLSDGSYRLRLKPGTTYTLHATAFRATETFLGGSSTLPRTPTARNSFKVGTSEMAVDTIRMNLGSTGSTGGSSNGAGSSSAAPSVKAAQKVLSTARALATKAKTAAEKKASSKAVAKAKAALKAAKVAKKAAATATKAGSAKATKMAKNAVKKAISAEKAAARALKSARKALR